MVDKYSRVSNLLGDPNFDKAKRKQILQIFADMEKQIEDLTEENNRLSKQYIAMISRVTELEKSLAEAITGKPDFNRYSYFVESNSRNKLERIKEILEEDFDWEEFYGDDN